MVIVFLANYNGGDFMLNFIFRLMFESTKYNVN